MEVWKMEDGRTSRISISIQETKEGRIILVVFRVGERKMRDAPREKMHNKL
jgi:hypothetical protein